MWNTILNKLLNKNGYSSIYYNEGRLAKRIQENFIFSRPLLDRVHQYCGYTDMELCGEFYAYRLIPLLDLRYPGSCFIYNTRDVSRWVDSRMNYRNGKYARTYLKRMQRALEDSNLTMDDLRLYWHEAWQRHDADLRIYFARRKIFFLHLTSGSLKSKPRFAVFYVDVAIESAERHCPTLELDQRPPKTHE